MKKSIKIIIVTLLIIFTFSVSSLAYGDIITPMKLSKEQIEDLASQNPEQAKIYLKDLQEYYNTGNYMQGHNASDINTKIKFFQAALGQTNLYGGIDYRNYNPSTDLSGNTTVTNMAANIIVLIRSIGIAVAFISLLLIGIKYMIGSANEKAEYKKTLVPFAVGVIILGLGTSLVTVIYDIIKGIL